MSDYVHLPLTVLVRYHAGVAEPLTLHVVVVVAVVQVRVARHYFPVRCSCCPGPCGTPLFSWSLESVIHVHGVVVRHGLVVALDHLSWFPGL